MEDYGLVLNVRSTRLKFCVFQRHVGENWRLRARGKIEELEHRLSAIRHSKVPKVGMSIGVSVMTTTDPMMIVRQYINAFNRGDTKAMAAAFAVPGSILDGMAPHVWHGRTATENWYRDLLVEGEHAGASGHVVTLDEPWHVNVTGDSAYVVFRTTQ